MGVHTYTHEFPLAVSPSRMFKAMILEGSTLAPKLMPQEIKSMDLAEEGGVKTRTTNFVEGGPVKFLKHRMDVLDVPNNYCKFTLVDGEPRIDVIESIVHEAKFEASANGCICKVVNHFHTKGDYVPTLDKLKEGDEKNMAMHKIVEQYLIANPEVCA